MDGATIVRDAYTRMALVYEERVVPRFGPVAQRTIDLAGLQPGERVLDVGCGTGLATLLAAERVGPKGSVVGIDFSEGQLGIAAGKAQLRGLGQARFERADATRLTIGGAYDAALCNFGLPDEYELALRGVYRALRPGGRLSLATWAAASNPFFDNFHRLLEAHRVEDPEPALEDLRDAIAERRLRRAELGTAAGLEAALRDAGFADAAVQDVVYPIHFEGWRDAFDFLVAWGWTEQEVRAMPGPRREAFHRALEDLYGGAPFDATWRVLHATGQRV